MAQPLSTTQNTPITGSPTTSRGARTRDAVREAAASCFAERGYDDTTGAEVGRRAGVSEATVFSYFGSKAGLLLAVMDDFYDRLLDETQEAAAAPGDATSRFRGLVDRWAARVEHDWSLIVVFGQQARYRSEDSEVSRRWAELNRRFTRAHLDVLAELHDAGRLADDLPLTLARDMLFGTLEHTGLGQMAAGRAIALRETARRLVDLLIGSDDAPTADVTDRLARIERKLDELGATS